MNRAELQSIIKQALAEDIGPDAVDVTSEAMFDPATQVNAKFILKADGVIAGLEVMQETFALVDPSVQVTCLASEGDRVQRGDVVATVSGSALSVLKAERIALNFMQRMSGIATLTRRMVDAVEGTNATILDTRKTVPGLRHIDKWAVRLGGGENHRMGLYDMILIKENHIAAAGGVDEALTRAVAVAKEKGIQIEIEVLDLDGLRKALEYPVDRIMLDNMTNEMMAEAVAINAGKTKLEASGNVRLDTVRDIALTGVDYISSGALTHSVMALDISLLHEQYI